MPNSHLPPPGLLLGVSSLALSGPRAGARLGLAESPGRPRRGCVRARAMTYGQDITGLRWRTCSLPFENISAGRLRGTAKGSPPQGTQLGSPRAPEGLRARPVNAQVFPSDASSEARRVVLDWGNRNRLLRDAKYQWAARNEENIPGRGERQACNRPAGRREGSLRGFYVHEPPGGLDGAQRLTA